VKICISMSLRFFKDGTLINDNLIDYSTEINYESQTVIGSKSHFRVLGGFGNKGVICEV